MINLRAAGSSNRCETLPEELDLETIASPALEGDHSRAFAPENLRTLEWMGYEPELARALETALEKSFGGEHARRQLAATRTELVETTRRLHDVQRIAVILASCLALLTYHLIVGTFSLLFGTRVHLLMHSWPNPVQYQRNTLSVLSRQCLERRIPDTGRL